METGRKRRRFQDDSETFGFCTLAKPTKTLKFGWTGHRKSTETILTP